MVPIKPYFAARCLLSMCAPSGGSRTAWRPERFGRRSKALCDRGRISDQNLVSNPSGGHAFRRYARASCAQKPLKHGLGARHAAQFPMSRQRLVTFLIHIYTHFMSFLPPPLETGARASPSDPFLHLFTQINTYPAQKTAKDVAPSLVKSIPSIGYVAPKSASTSKKKSASRDFGGGACDTNTKIKVRTAGVS